MNLLNNIPFSNSDSTLKSGTEFDIEFESGLFDVEFNVACDAEFNLAFDIGFYVEFNVQVQIEMNTAVRDTFGKSRRKLIHTTTIMLMVMHPPRSGASTRLCACHTCRV